jgi:nitroreductase
VGPADLSALFEAARLAPSNGNRQPWRFVVRSAPDERAELSPCLSMGNQWALQAPVLATLVTRVASGGLSNGIPYAFFDCGLAAMSLVIEAESRGLRVHQMAGWNREPLIRLLRLPEDVDPIVIMAIGYEGDAGMLSSELRDKEVRQRLRKDHEEIWTTGVWNDAWSERHS